MPAHDATRQSRRTGVGDIVNGNAGTISIRSSAQCRVLRAGGFQIESRRIGRYIAPRARKERR
mgnify:CR=1 FL=1|jgi:hypothetical protein